MATVAAMSGVPVGLLIATTTGSGNIVAPPVSFTRHQVLLSVPAGVTAGVVQVETSQDDTYAGTWAPVGTTTTVPAASSAAAINFSGIYRFLRVRVTTTISGGGAPSVSADYLGSQW